MRFHVAENCTCEYHDFSRFSMTCETWLCVYPKQPSTSFSISSLFIIIKFSAIWSYSSPAFCSDCVGKRYSLRHLAHVYGNIFWSRCYWIFRTRSRGTQTWTVIRMLPNHKKTIWRIGYKKPCGLDAREKPQRTRPAIRPRSEWLSDWTGRRGCL